MHRLETNRQEKRKKLLVAAALIKRQHALLSTIHYRNSAVPIVGLMMQCAPNWKPSTLFLQRAIILPFFTPRPIVHAHILVHVIRPSPEDPRARSLWVFNEYRWQDRSLYAERAVRPSGMQDTNKVIVSILKCCLGNACQHPQILAHTISCNPFEEGDAQVCTHSMNLKAVSTSCLVESVSQLWAHVGSTYRANDTGRTTELLTHTPPCVWGTHHGLLQQLSHAAHPQLSRSLDL